jgi:hypothetical protein
VNIHSHKHTLEYITVCFRLTEQQGEHVKGCIQNGAVLAGAALLLGFPPTAILSTLPMIAQLGGCGDVIDFGAVNLSQLKDLGNLVR